LRLGTDDAAVNRAVPVSTTLLPDGGVMLGPILETPRLSLGPPRAEDLPGFVAWFADTEVTRFLLRRHPPSLRQEEQWLERVATSEQDVVWTIVVREGGPLIGVIGLHRIDWRSRHAWIEIVLGDRASWGRGYGTEAVKACTGYAFAELGLEKVLASVYGGHAASLRILDALGYRQAGLLRRNAFFSGEWHDEWLGEVLCGEWKA
jgi:RimJ/RimL family protein N-acetyltransferase